MPSDFGKRGFYVFNANARLVAGFDFTGDNRGRSIAGQKLFVVFGRTGKGYLHTGRSSDGRSAIDHRIFCRCQISSHELCELVQSHHAQASFPAH